MIPEIGERALSIGQTGSGKTAFNLWLLQQHEQTPFIIYDTKFEPKFDSLPASKRVYSQEGVEEALDDETIDYVIYEPAIEIVGAPSELDHLLWTHYCNYQQVGAYIDEVTNFNSNPLKVEKGLLSILTRGRSKGITTLMSTQRPKGLATACLTEAQKFYIFALTFRQDKKRIDEYIPGYEEMPPLTVGEFKFYYKEIGKPGLPQLYNPVPLDIGLPAGYVDLSPQIGEVASDQMTGSKSGHDEKPAVKSVNPNSLLWL